MILLCTSQQENSVPYRFPGTGIQVYTFEEVMYHIYHHWKQSVDDVVAPGLAAWVNDALGLSFVSSKIKETARIEQFSERMLAFLRIVPYFDDEDLDVLAPEFERWEKRLEWETYKERADDLVNRGEPDKAIALYRRALRYDENIAVLNNLGVAYMQLEAFDEACRCFERALEHEENNWELRLHYTEALIAAKRFDEGTESIVIAAVSAPVSASVIGSGSAYDPAEAKILYLRGELAVGLGDTSEAISYFEQAIELSSGGEPSGNGSSGGEPSGNGSSGDAAYYRHRLADIYASRRQFDKALSVLTVNSKRNSPGIENNPLFLMKAAEIYYLAEDLPSAIKSIKKALNINTKYIELWIRLARYHRLNYDLPKAEEAITKALSLDSNNERARLESARIQKSLGRTKIYQGLLKGILSEIKNKYREVN